MDEKNQKINWVADFIHYPIIISNIEKQIISTRILNRLHNILQNSTAYFTYPSNRTSRFSHSLGCLHVTGEIFHNGLLNATRDDRNQFLKVVINEIEKIISSGDFKKDTENISAKQNAYRKDIENHYKDALLIDPIYLRVLPSDILDSKDKQFAFIIAFQSIRIVALLHDLGHPPYSHITERAIERIFNDIYNEKAVGDTLNSKKEEFFRIMNYYKVSHKDFHEQIGIELLKPIFMELDDDINENPPLCYAYLIIRHFVNNILIRNTKKQSINDLYWTLHRIVDSDFDADRIDYVLRDSIMSGQSIEPYRLGRLLNSFQLIFYKDELEDNKVRQESICEFLPSVRALSSIEEFYHRRLDLYKYVIFHHRVVKTDGLLQECVINVAKDYFDNEEKNEFGNDYLLPSNISGLWKVLDPDNKFYLQNQILNFIQWDDAWLLSILRGCYSQKLQKSIDEKQNKRDLLEIQLEEILSNKKKYFSLFKRGDSFSVIDEVFCDNVPESFDWKILLKLIKRTPDNEKKKVFRGKVQKIASYFNQYKIDKKNTKLEMKGFRDTEGFFIANLFEIFIAAMQDTIFIEIINKALKNLSQKYTLDDAIVLRKALKPGITSDFKLIQDNSVIRIGTVSRIVDEMNRGITFFSPFYVYVYNGKKISNNDLQQMRNDFGKFLWDSFREWTITIENKEVNHVTN